MKIGPAPPPPLPARQSRPVSDLAGGSGARAARFSEFGMFGLNEPPPLRPPGTPPAPAVARCPTPPTRAGLERPPTPADPPTVSVEAALDRLCLPSSEATARPPLHDPAVKATEQACSLPEEAAVKAVEIDDCAGPEAPPRPPQPRLRQPPPGPAVSLTLREENGAVEIVAGSSPIDPESRVLLRRLVEAMLARSGLALAHFQLNGAPLAPDSLGRRGGSHGTRTR